jgi:ATP-dependent Lon protease
MKLHFVDTMDDVLHLALEGPLPQLSEDAAQPIAPITQPPAESPTAHQ